MHEISTMQVLQRSRRGFGHYVHSPLSNAIDATPPAHRAASSLAVCGVRDI